MAADRDLRPLDSPLSARDPRGRRSKAGRLSSEITKAELQEHYYLSIEFATQQIQVGLTTLKHVCRKYGIVRWPFRKVQQVHRLAVLTHSGVDMSPGDQLQMLELLADLAVPADNALWSNLGAPAERVIRNVLRNTDWKAFHELLRRRRADIGGLHGHGHGDSDDSQFEDLAGSPPSGATVSGRGAGGLGTRNNSDANSAPTALLSSDLAALAFASGAADANAGAVVGAAAPSALGAKLDFLREQGTAAMLAAARGDAAPGGGGAGAPPPTGSLQGHAAAASMLLATLQQAQRAMASQGGGGQQQVQQRGNIHAALAQPTLMQATAAWEESRRAGGRASPGGSAKPNSQPQPQWQRQLSHSGAQAAGAGNVSALHNALMRSASEAAREQGDNNNNSALSLLRRLTGGGGGGSGSGGFGVSPFASLYAGLGGTSAPQLQQQQPSTYGAAGGAATGARDRAAGGGGGGGGRDFAAELGARLLHGTQGAPLPAAGREQGAPPAAGPKTGGYSPAASPQSLGQCDPGHHPQQQQQQQQQLHPQQLQLLNHRQQQQQQLYQLLTATLPAVTAPPPAFVLPPLTAPPSAHVPAPKPDSAAAQPYFDAGHLAQLAALINATRQHTRMP